MSNKKLGILATIACVMIFWAVAQSYIANRPAVGDEVPGYLIGGVEIDNIASIRIVTKEEPIRLIRQGKGFVLGNRGDYPAKTGEVNNLIASCLDIKPAELITDNKENHEALGVSEGKARYVVTLFDKDANPITGFYLSERDYDAPGGGNTYARKLDEDKVYRLKDDTFPYINTMDYVEQELIKAERTDIQRVTVTSPDGAYTLQRDKEDQDKIILATMPEGKKFKGSDYKTVFEALSSLRFDDVKSFTEDMKKLEFTTTYVCELKDSTVYTLKIAKNEEKYWIQAAAEFTDKTPVTMTRGQTESEEELKKKEARLLAEEKAQKFAQMHKNWLYEISSYKADNLTKKLSDLLEDEKKEEPKPETGATPSDTDISDPNSPSVR
ncbi:MAG: DUF4340 domain-containing protein [Sedimentisphaerales bacterium]|nr:DUF4340 domain-containing protein [Sedimentisphaerales bacterium]